MRLVKVVVALAVIWSALWGLTALGLRNAVTNWFAARADEGWQADFTAAETGGYPLRHDTVLRQPMLADPATGAAWSADWIGIESPAVWPGRQSLRFAETPQYLSYFDDTQTLTAAGMVADLDLAPGLALQLERLSLSADAWKMAGDDAPSLAGNGLTVAMVQQDDPALYRLDVAVPDFTPGPRLRGMLDGADSLPESFETLQLDADVRFDRPWDRRALEERRPQPLRIDLRLAEASWGPLRLFMSGGVDVTPDGVPEGQVTLRAENWRDMLGMAQSAGVLPETVAQSAERALNFLAGLDGKPDAIDVRLNLTGGFVAVGPLPVAAAPRLILR